jgi:hypothetical protein
MTPSHTCAPEHWRTTPNMTGDYDLDAAIMHNRNSDLPQRLNLYLAPRPAYRPRTGYHSYDGYHGDD